MALLYASTYAAAPYGLEVPLIYNGLTLNYGKFAATIAKDGGAYFVTAIGGLDDADVRFSEANRPDMDGSIPGTIYHGSRTITIEGYILGQNLERMRYYQQNLREAFALPLSPESSLVFWTGATTSDVYINCRKSAPLQMREALPTQASRFARRDFQITLKASDPRFLSSLQVSTGVLRASTGSTFTASNAGNYYAYPQVAITGPFGAGLTLTNSLNSNVLRLDTAIAAGSTLTVDVQTRRVTLDGANSFSYLSATTAWPYLNPGTQTLTLGGITLSTTASAVNVNWRHAWI